MVKIEAEISEDTKKVLDKAIEDSEIEWANSYGDIIENAVLRWNLLLGGEK